MVRSIIYVIGCLLLQFTGVLEAGAAVKQPCGNTSPDCDENLVCDNTYCKIDVNGDCSTSQDGCKTGTTCENNLCKIDVNGDCSTSHDDCKTGTTCENNLCKPNSAVRNSPGTTGVTCSLFLSVILYLASSFI